MADATPNVIQRFSPMDRVRLASELYLAEEDFLRWDLINAVASAVYEVAGVLVTPAGQWSPFAQQATPASDRSIVTVRFRPGEGLLTHAHVRVVSGTVLQGQCYTTLRVQRGEGSVGTLYAALIEGYVSGLFRPVWPQGPFIAPVEGEGVPKVVTGTNPAAGAEISETVPTRTRWKLRAVQVQLVTDATAANRIPVLVLDDGTTTFARIQMTTAQAASLTRDHTWALGLTDAVDTVSLMGRAPLPEVTLRAGFRIRTETTAIVAGDNYGAPALFVQEYIDT